jgi:hypothetical protein
MPQANSIISMPRFTEKQARSLDRRRFPPSGKSGRGRLHRFINVPRGAKRRFRDDGAGGRIIDRRGGGVGNDPPLAANVNRAFVHNFQQALSRIPAIEQERTVNGDLGTCQNDPSLAHESSPSTRDYWNRHSSPPPVP